MISVIKVTNGTYNVIGVSRNEFIIQGNLTKPQLIALKAEIVKALKP